MNEDFNIKVIAEEIKKKHSITEKLDYWLEIKRKYIDEPLKEIESEYILTNKMNRTKLLSDLFGEDSKDAPKTYTPIHIPIEIYTEHFKEGINNPEYCYWFLKHEAKEYFEFLVKNIWEENLTSPIADKLIEAELSDLNRFQRKADDLLSNTNIKFKDSGFNQPYYREIELLRINDEFYKTNKSILSIYGVNDTVELYAKHIFLKEYLEDKLKKITPLNDNVNRNDNVVKEPEPTAKIKTWVVFFEMDNNYSHKINTERIFEKRNWKSSINPILNNMNVVQKIDRDKKCDNKVYKNSLFEAIQLLTGTPKEKASKLHSSLK